MTNTVNVIITGCAIIVLLVSAGFALHRERSRVGLLLSAALVVTALLELFDLCALTITGGAIFWKRIALFTESFLPPFWILSSMTYARQYSLRKFSWLLKGAVALSFLFCALPAIFPVSAFYYAPDFPIERLLFLGNAGYFYYIGICVCLVFALVNFEITLAHASPDSLWKIKYDIIGIGTILFVLVFYYSQAFLYRSLNMNYLPLRSFLYLVAAALMTYSQLCRRGNVRIQVSHQAAFKSVVLIGVGFYLVMLGLLGEGMHYVGSTFQRNLTISIAFLVGIALLTLFLSARVRREVQVVLHKNFYQQKYDYRTQWLHFTEQLSSSRSGEELLQCILSAYCNIFGIGGAALFLHEEARGGYCGTAHYEMEPIQEVITAENSLVVFMKKSAWVVNVSDNVPDYTPENSHFFSKNHISFVIPLFAGDHLEGFIALGKVIKVNEVYIYEDYDLMKTIGRQASLAILHQRLSEQITQAREIEAIGNVAAFISHDLKNLVSNLSLIVENAARHIHNPDFQQDMLTSLGNTVVKMQRLIGSLNNLGEGELFKKRQVNLLELVQKTSRLVSGAPIMVSGTPQTALVDENEIQKVLLNLFINGIEASGPNEPVLAEVGYDGAAYIRVTDRGCGMSAGFIRSELFKPFRTTKKQGLGIGLYQCRKIVAAHDGRIEVSSVEGDGSVFIVWFADPAYMRTESQP